MKWHIPFRVAFVIMGVIMVTLLFFFIHEIGHILALKYIGINITKIMVRDNWSMGVCFKSIKNPHKARFVIIAGSGFAIIVGLVLCLHAYKVRSNTLYLGSAVSISYNLLYWAYSVIYRDGDGWLFIQTYNNFNPYFIIIPCLIAGFTTSCLAGWGWAHRFYDYYYPN